MDRLKESGNDSLQLLAAISEGVESLEQGLCRKAAKAIQKSLAALDARNRALGTPTDFERQFRKLQQRKKKEKEMVTRIKTMAGIKLVDELPDGEFKCLNQEYQNSPGFGNDVQTDGVVKVLEHSYEPRQYKGGTDRSYKKIRVSGANWLVAKEWFHGGDKVRRSITIKKSWLEAVDQESLGFLQLACIIGGLGVRYIAFQRGYGLILPNGGVRDCIGKYNRLPSYTEGKMMLRIFFRDRTARSIPLDVRPKYVGDAPLYSESGWDPGQEEIFIDTIEAAFLVA